MNLTVGNIAEEILRIFPGHIGRNKAITKNELFKELFDKSFDEDSPSDYLRWDFVLKAMHKLRKETACFIVGIYDHEFKERVYFVIANQVEADIYVNRLKQSVKKINAMAKRAKKSVDEKWYSKPSKWVLPNRKKLA